MDNEWHYFCSIILDTFLYTFLILNVASIMGRGYWLIRLPTQAELTSSRGLEWLGTHKSRHALPSQKYLNLLAFPFWGASGTIVWGEFKECQDSSCIYQDRNERWKKRYFYLLVLFHFFIFLSLIFLNSYS